MEPIVDWDISIRLAANDIKHAKEYLNLLKNDIVFQKDNIKQLLKDNNTKLACDELHMLLGILSYSGALRLKSATKSLYHALLHQHDFKKEFDNFETELNCLVEYIDGC